MIDFACSGCGKPFQVKEEFAGRKTTCRDCGCVLTVPAKSKRAKDSSTKEAGKVGRSDAPRARPVQPSASPAGRKRAILFVVAGAGILAVLTFCVGLPIGLAIVFANRSSTDAPIVQRTPSAPSSQPEKSTPATPATQEKEPKEKEPKEKEPKEKEPKEKEPSQPGEDLKGGSYSLDDLKVTPIKLDSKLLRPCMVWADAKGTAVIIADGNGVLRRVSFPDLHTVKQADLERKVNWMAMSAEGIVLSMPDQQQVWLVDPATFDVKIKVDVPKVKQVAASPAHGFAVVSDREWSNTKAFVIDLTKGRAVEYPIPTVPKFIGFHDPVMTPDGKYVFTTYGDSMHRFTFKDGTLKFDESSKQLIGGALPVGVQVSPDSKFVCHPAGGGNVGAPKPYDILVFPVNSFQKTECSLEGVRADAVGFDAVAGYIYSSRFRRFSMTGILKKEYQGKKGFPDFAQQPPLQILVHSEGRKMLYLTSASLSYLEVPAKTTDKPADSAAMAKEAEDKAVAFIIKVTGKVKRDEKQEGKPVVGVDLWNAQRIDDAALKELAGLKELQTLDLRATRISDAGLKELAGFQQLRILYLSTNQIGDAGVKELAGLQKLQELHLNKTNIGDAALKELAGLQQLKILLVEHTQVTKNGVAELQKALPKCKIIYNAK